MTLTSPPRFDSVLALLQVGYRFLESASRAAETTA